MYFISALYTTSAFDKCLYSTGLTILVHSVTCITLVVCIPVYKLGNLTKLMQMCQKLTNLFVFLAPRMWLLAVYWLLDTSWEEWSQLTTRISGLM